MKAIDISMAKLGLSSTVLAALVIGGALMAMVHPALGQELKVAASPKEHHPHHRQHQHHQHHNHSTPRHEPHHHHHHKKHSRAPGAEAPSPTSPEVAYLESVPKIVQDYIDNCTHNVSPKCGEEIVGSLFGATNVTIPCCYQLLNIGIKCHTALVNVFAGLPNVKRGAPIIRANSRKVFTYCIEEVRKNHELDAEAPAYP